VEKKLRDREWRKGEEIENGGREKRRRVAEEGRDRKSGGRERDRVKIIWTKLFVSSLN
jgi:hypothetical protein